MSNNFNPCRACPMAGLCDSDECGMKLYSIDTNKAPKLTAKVPQIQATFIKLPNRISL